MAKLNDAEKKARSIVNKWSAGATAVGWVPGSMLALGAADFAMIQQVAETFEVKKYSTEQVVAMVSASFGGKLLVEGLSFIPGPGWLLKAAVAGGVTKSMGEATIKYFRERSPLDEPVAARKASSPKISRPKPSRAKTARKPTRSA